MPGLFDGTPLQRPVTCERCEKPLDQCACPRDERGNVMLPRDQTVRVQRERRRGSWATVITGLNPSATDIPALAQTLRRKYATGGSAKDGVIELQGDHRDAVVTHLTLLGYAAKASGG